MLREYIVVSAPFTVKSSRCYLNNFDLQTRTVSRQFVIILLFNIATKSIGENRMHV